MLVFIRTDERPDLRGGERPFHATDAIVGGRRGRHRSRLLSPQREDLATQGSARNLAELSKADHGAGDELSPRPSRASRTVSGLDKGG